MRYVVDFGLANTGGTPTVNSYVRTDTLAAVPSPTLAEIGATGQFYWDQDWTTTTATSIAFKFTLNGTEMSDVIEASSASAITSASATVAGYSTSGYQTAGPLVARAAVQCSILALSRAQIAAYDPFASTDPEIQRLIEILDTLGMDLASKVKAHLHRELTLTTAASATSYELPSDYAEMVPGSMWNRGQVTRLVGPVSPQRAQTLKAWSTSNQVYVEHRIQGNRLTFPVAPSDGLTIAGEYVSRNWVQTAGSSTGPDTDHVTDRTDYVLFDPLLVVLGIKAEWLAAKGYEGAALALAKYEERLAWAKGAVGSAPVLSLSGGYSDFRLLSGANLPPTGWGN